MADVRKIMGDLRSAKTRTFAQIAIEKMQIALKKGEAGLTRAVERGKKLVEDAVEREKEARGLKIDLLSNYKDAADWFRENLADADLEKLELEHYQRQIKKIEMYLTDEQKNVVKEWAKMRAGVDIQEINNIEDLLVAKGQNLAAPPAPPTRQERAGRRNQAVEA